MGLRLLAVSGFALLSGCGWLFGDSAPKGNARPGVDRQGPATGTLPAASGQHDSGLAPTDPVGAREVGSIIPAKGGQKAQKEAADKDAAERDTKEREERQKREADEREAKAKEQQEGGGKEMPKGTPEKRALPGMPAAAERGNPESAGPSDKKPAAAPAQSAPASAGPAAPGPVTSAPGTSAPVTSAPIVPPPPAAPPPSAAPAPEPPPAQPPRT
jgi:hypothetical protein